MCKTNPIWPAGRGPEVQMCKTKPIWGVRSAPLFHYSMTLPLQSYVDFAKRTQFLPPCRSGDRRSQGDCAKRTQFPAVPGGRDPAREGQSRKTKPIWRWRPEMGAVGRPPRGKLGKTKPTDGGQDNAAGGLDPCLPSAARGRNQKCLLENKMLRLCSAGATMRGRLVQTKPISGGRDTHYSIIPPFRSNADCAKRSQLAEEFRVCSFKCQAGEAEGAGLQTSHFQLPTAAEPLGNSVRKPVDKWA